MRHATLCKFSGTFHSYVMLRYCKFSGTFHSCVMPRYCKFSGTISSSCTHDSCHATLFFHVSSLELSMHTSYVMLRYCKFSWSFHSHLMLRYCKFSWTFHSYVMLRYCKFKFSGTFHSCACHAIVSSLGRTRSVAVTNTGIKTCQVEYFENAHKPQKW